MKTLIPVSYSDATNSGAWTDYLLSGSLDEAMLDRLRATLDSGEQFVPTQLGLDHLGAARWDGIDNVGFPDDELDHPWHVLHLDRVQVLADDADVIGETVPVGTPEEFTARMEAARAAGWDDSCNLAAGH